MAAIHSDSSRIDSLDREILSLLVDDARLSFRDLGAAVGLSSNAVAERVRKLRRRGVITGFTALVDPTAGGEALDAIVDVRLRPDRDGETFERAIFAMPAVTEAMHVTGRFDYQLRLRCRDAADLDANLRALKRGGGVAESDTRLVLSTALRRR